MSQFGIPELTTGVEINGGNSAIANQDNSLISNSGNGMQRPSWRSPELLSIGQIQTVQLIGIARCDQNLSI